jgi:hypothetical protein
MNSSDARKGRKPLKFDERLPDLNEIVDRNLIQVWVGRKEGL